MRSTRSLSESVETLFTTLRAHQAEQQEPLVNTEPTNLLRYLYQHTAAYTSGKDSNPEQIRYTRNSTPLFPSVTNDDLTVTIRNEPSIRSTQRFGPNDLRSFPTATVKKAYADEQEHNGTSQLEPLTHKFKQPCSVEAIIYESDETSHEVPNYTYTVDINGTTFQLNDESISNERRQLLDRVLPNVRMLLTKDATYINRSHLQ